MIGLLFLGVAIAAEPPALPKEAEPISGQCAKSYSFTESDDIPAGVIDGRVASCGGVLMPTSEVADLINYKTYAVAINSLYRLDTEDLESKLRVSEAEVELLKRPVPWLQSPSGQRWVGRGEVTAIVVGIVVSAFYIDKANQK